VTLAPVPIRSLGERGTGERSAAVRARVEVARDRQRRRYRGQRGARCNGHASGRAVSVGAMEPNALSLLHDAAERLKLSARGYHRVLKLARTIADLADRDVVAAADVAEALRYRPRVEADEGQVASA
jgi:magnesium chelatase family protein